MGRLAQKQATVEELKDLTGASAAMVLDYRGLRVSDVTALRKELLKEQARMTVTKNTLMRRAIEGTDLAVMNALLKGPTAIIYTSGDQVKPVKIVKEYLKKNKKENEIRGGYLDGKVLSAKEVDALATLPPIEELRAKLLGGIAAPMNGLVMALNGPQRALVNVLDQFAKQKQQ